MKKSTIFWLLSAVFLIATIIDVIDGYLPKLISSLFLTIGFAMLALAQGPTNKTALKRTALFCFMIALASAIYRLMLHFEVS